MTKQIEFDLVSKLRNLCIKIPLVKEIRDIPTYAKIVRELCIKKLGRQKKEPSTIEVGGKITFLVSTGFATKKYADPRILVVTTFINGYLIMNTLSDLVASINIITIETPSHIGFFDFPPTHTAL